MKKMHYRISLTTVEDASPRLYCIVIMMYIFSGIVLYFFTQLYLKTMSKDVECIKNLTEIRWCNYDARTNDDIQESLDYIPCDQNQHLLYLIQLVLTNMVLMIMMMMEKMHKMWFTTCYRKTTFAPISF